MKFCTIIISLLLAASAISDEVRAEKWGFDPEDSTEILQQALNSGAQRLIISKQASPWIVGKTLKLPSNMEIVFEKDAEIRAKEGAFQGITDMLLSANGCQNLTLRGPGILSMRKSDYLDKSKYKHAEWRHTLGIVNSSNITVDGLTMRDSGGDGIYVNNVKDIVIDNVNCDNHTRQGISIISAENLLVKNSKFNNTYGASPECGIDFEPNRNNEKLINCVIENCEFSGNKQCGVLFAIAALDERSAPISITLRNCVIKNNTKGAYIVNHSNRPVKGSILFENCTFVNSKEYTFLSSGQLAGGYSLTLKDSTLDNRGVISSGAFELSGSYVNGDLGNVHFENVKAIDSRADGQAFKFGGWQLHRLKNLHGNIIDAKGRKTEMTDIIAESAKYTICETLELKGKSLVPVADGSVESGFQRQYVRFSGIFLQYAEAGEEITIHGQISFWRKAPIPFEAVSPSGKTIGTYQLQQEKDSSFTFKAPESGIYELKYNTGVQGLALSSSRPGNGFLADNPLKMIASAGKMYFLVPAGVKDFAVRVSGDNEREVVSVRLLDPNGKKIASLDKVFIPDLLFHTRQDASRDEAWCIEIVSSVEDFTLSVLGAIPVLADAPEKLLKFKNSVNE